MLLVLILSLNIPAMIILLITYNASINTNNIYYHCVYVINNIISINTNNIHMHNDNIILITYT